MTTQNFCYFLQGYMELTDPKTISAKDLKMIKGHLKLAFRDDIDPSINNGDMKHHQDLNNAHEGKIDLQDFFAQNPHLNPHGNNFPNPSIQERC